MVLLGLVLGVVLAVIVAAQGCGGNHPRKRTFHGGGSPPAASSAGGAAAGAGGGAAASVAARVGASTPVRAMDPQGAFVGFAHGRMTRWDAPRSRMVALTFDDGPGPETPTIIRELRGLHARATFFVVGSMAATRPAVVREAARAGMEIGNHTWSHPAMPTLPLRAQRTEIERTNQILHALTGRRPRFFRPPDWRIGSRTARIVRSEQMVGVLRTVDTRDWTLPGARAIVRAALSVQPGGIVAMHDAGGYTRAQTAAAVPVIVRGLRRRHLKLVTVGELYAGRV